MRKPLGAGSTQRKGSTRLIRTAHACLLVALEGVTAASATSARVTPRTEVGPVDGRVWAFSGPGGGTVRALAIDPLRPEILYAGTEQGGVFKSTDGGSSWGTANRGLPPSPEVRTVVINPTDAAILYAGARGAGVFRSTNAGGRWISLSSGLHSLDVNALLSDPAVPGTLYAATTDGGIFKTVDGGTVWSAINTGLASAQVSCLAFDPADSTTVYAGTQGAGIFKTTDGGGHWRAGAASTPRYVNGLAIDRLSPNTVYAATVDGISKSTDGGVNWFTADAGISYSNGGTPVSVLSLVIDPTDSSVLWAGSYTAGVFTSTDGGATWVLASADSPSTTYALALGRAALYAGGFGLSKSTDRGTSWNTTGLPLVVSVNALDIDAADPTTLYIATAGEGVLKSTDGAATWSRASSGLTTPYINDTKVDVSATAILYAGTDEGLFKSTDAGGSWRATILSGETRVLAIAATQPPTVLAASFDRSIGYDVFRSTDTGATWHPSGLPSALITGLAVDPLDPRTIYAGRAHTYGVKNGGIVKSTDGGAHWAATGLLTFDGVHPLAVDPESSAVVYAAYGGGVLKSTDGGDSWRAMNNGLPDGRAAQLVFDPLDPHRMYVSAGDVFTSTDAAASWTMLGNHFAPSVLALAVDPVTGTTLYAGTSSGVFVLQRTDLDPTRPARATPTPTSTPDPRCPADQITLVPSTAPPGARVMLSGLCYFIHSGRRADVYFDTTLVGEVRGDTNGAYALEFTVPGDALPGPHQVRVIGAQSATLQVQPDEPIPTPTPPVGAGNCPTDNITVVPNAGTAGTRIVVSGQCYYLHSGRGGEIYFDDTRLGAVSGDTGGDYEGGFVVPVDAVPGPHVVRLVAFLATNQSTTFEVEAAASSPTSTATFSPTPTHTPPATQTPTATVTIPAIAMGGGGGGCTVVSARRAAGVDLILLCAPVALLASSVVRKRVSMKSVQALRDGPETMGPPQGEPKSFLNATIQPFALRSRPLLAASRRACSRANRHCLRGEGSGAYVLRQT